MKLYFLIKILQKKEALNKIYPLKYYVPSKQQRTLRFFKVDQSERFHTDVFFINFEQKA